jgi:hypothetical protein
MLVEVKDLEIGDEIMISGNSHFRYLKSRIKPFFYFNDWNAAHK